MCDSSHDCFALLDDLYFCERLTPRVIVNGEFEWIGGSVKFGGIWSLSV